MYDVVRPAGIACRFQRAFFRQPFRFHLSVRVPAFSFVTTIFSTGVGFPSPKMSGDTSMSSYLSVKAIRQGKSACLDIWCQGKSPCLDMYLIECCVLYRGESVGNIWNSPFHGRLLSFMNVSMRTLLCATLLPAPAPVRQLYVAQLRYLLLLQIWTQFVFFCITKKRCMQFFTGMFCRVLVLL